MSFFLCLLPNPTSPHLIINLLQPVLVFPYINQILLTLTILPNISQPAFFVISKQISTHLIVKKFFIFFLFFFSSPRHSRSVSPLSGGLFFFFFFWSRFRHNVIPFPELFFLCMYVKRMHTSNSDD